jgi:glutamate formiminotransferase
MQTTLYELVPNLSEGRDAGVIAAAASAVEQTGAKVLHQTSDAVHHRSVLTIVGSARDVLEAAIALARVAVERIDLRGHRGVHPRIGALDVLPFVPLRGGATLAEAAKLAQSAATQIWERWRVPSFLYGAAALREEHRLLPDVRKGGFEALDERLAADPPDVGNSKHPTAGAIAIGARPILIAFNVVLATPDFRIATSIARAVRERNGGLRGLRALGFDLGDGHVQVSLNVTDYTAVPLHRAVETIRVLAAEQGVEVANSELIGCLPLDAVKAAAAYYLGLADSAGL